MTAAEGLETTRSPQGGSAVIAATKLHIPAARPGLVARGALVGMLVEGAARKLTLIDAPPGFGKTTLLAEWRASPAEKRPFAWLSLDEGDNDPVRFWASVLDALRTVEPGLGGRAEAALGNRNIGLEDAVLPLLINELSALPGPMVLVLDDYHLVGEERVHRSLAFLLGHLPESLRLALATRSDPPLPLGRLRSRGELTEIRASELRFSDAEAAGLLRGALGLDLDRADVARLQERTEGWAAGLYLAALSLRGRDDPRDFIESFAGDDRQIVDYLLSEVLAGQRLELRSFLLRTSILERLCGPLCDAVTAMEGSARKLEGIERSNLFLVPLDTTRHWYRYHHLFGGLLRHELELVEPDLVPTLHRRACAWFGAEGSVPEAVHHAAAAGEVDHARELIALNWNAFFNQGRHETVAGWLAAIPEDAVAADPRLCVARAWLAMDAGRLDEADRWIALAEAGIRAGLTAEGQGSVESDTATLRAVHCFKVGDLEEGKRAARRLLELEPEGVSFPRTVAHLILGATLYWQGELQEALSLLDEGARLARAAGNDLGHSYALGYLALARVDMGELDEAERLATAATGLSDDPGFVEHFVPMLGHLARGRVAERRGRLEHAERAIGRAEELSRRGAGRLEIAGSLLALARVRQSLGERDEAKGRLREARRALEGCVETGTLTSTLSIAERGLGLTPATPGPGGAREELTDRELAVLRLLNSELSQREIGAALYISENTVKTHTKSIYRKLGAASRGDAVHRARELGLG